MLTQIRNRKRNEIYEFTKLRIANICVVEIDI